MNIILRRLIAPVAVASLLATAALSVGATNGNPINKGSQARYTIAVIGDVPYGQAKVNAFPEFIDFINDDPKVDLVAHLGDIKSGSTECSNGYFAWVRDELERLKDPVVYTPGDNEWVDCHRANNGNYQPTERLDQIRTMFFPTPGETLGVREKQVLTQADDPDHAAYVENVMWMESGVVFATFNIQGSNNDSEVTNPWTGAWAGDPGQATERAARDAANLAWLAKAFETAEANDAKGVAIMLQADMWDAFGTAATLDGFNEFVVALGNHANEFKDPVLLLVGDSHVYTEDHPYDGSAFFTSRQPNAPVALNVTRVIVEGSTVMANRFEYLRLTVDPNSDELFQFERADYYFD